MSGSGGNKVVGFPTLDLAVTIRVSFPKKSRHPADDEPVFCSRDVSHAAFTDLDEAVTWLTAVQAWG
jgi:hypothetical protein